MTVGEFKKLVAETQKNNTRWRYGQTVFNVMHALFPEKADKFTGTHLDPFYVDDRADAFITACLTEWKEG